MTPRRRQRLILVVLMLLGASAAVAFGVKAFQDNIALFRSPSDVVAGLVDSGQRFRIGGMVQEGSVERRDDNLDIAFKLTDYAQTVQVTYTGILPDLFREGQGIVAMGALNDQGVFVASEVLAKHDENYMPPEVAEALEKSGKMPGTKANYGAESLLKP